MILLVSLLPPCSVSAEDTFQLQPYFREATFTAFTRARREMTITSEVAARCLAVFADIGDTLDNAGHLADLDPTFLDLDLLANHIAHEQVNQQLAIELKTLNRYKTLREQQTVTEATLDDVTLQAELHKLALKKLENDAQRLHEQRQRHSLIGPAGWTVVERMIEPGEFIQAGQSVARLGDYRQLKLVLSLSFNELLILNERTTLDVHLPALGVHVPATLHRIAPDFDRETRKIEVELLLQAAQPGLGAPLRGGIRAEITLNTPSATSAFLVPTSALMSRYDAHWLMTPDRHRVRVLLLGRTSDDTMAIISGNALTPEETYLLSPREQSNLKQ